MRSATSGIKRANATNAARNRAAESANMRIVLKNGFQKPVFFTGSGAGTGAGSGTGSGSSGKHMCAWDQGHQSPGQDIQL